jgi:hypothetical protein
MQSSMDANEEGFLNCARYGLMLAIRVGIGRNEWALLIYYPDKTDGKPVVAKFTGTREAANAVARRKIDNWLKEQKRKPSQLL